MRRLACLPLLACLVCLAACAGSSKPAEDESALSACSEAPDVACDNGHPLCFVDHERVCRVCRCSAFALVPAVTVPSTAPGAIPQPIPPSFR